MRQNWLYKLFLAIFWVIFAIIFSVIVWGLNKGFDFTDEGFCTLAFSKGQEDVWCFLPIYSLISKLTSIFDPGILFFRISRLVLLLFSSFIFSFGFIAWCRVAVKCSYLPLFNIFYPIIFLTTLMSYAFGYQMLSYNSLTLGVAEITTGLFFLYLSFALQDIRNEIKTHTILAWAGFFLGLLFLIKYPTAVILTVVLVVIIFITELKLRRKTIKQVLLNLLSFFSGILLLIFLLSVCFHSPLVIINGIVKGKEYLPAHNAAFLLQLYAGDFYNNFLMIIIHHKIMLIGPIIMWLAFRFSKNNILFISVIVILLFVTEDAIDNEYYRAGTTHLYTASAFYILIALFCILFIFLNVLDKQARDLWGRIVFNPFCFFSGLFLLFIIPLICTFGTANVPSVHITQFVFSWVLIFVFMLFVLFLEFPYAKYLFLFATLLIMLNVSSQIIYGYVFSPYRVNTPLTEQQFTVQELPAGNTILFDYETSVFLKSTVEKLKNHNALIKSQPIISIYDYPGLIYLLGGFSPGNALYFDSGFANYYNSGYLFDYDRTNCFFILNSKMKNLNKTVLLVEQKFGVSKELSECLTQKGICFPDKYFKADSVRIPREENYLYLYLPRD